MGMGCPRIGLYQEPTFFCRSTKSLPLSGRQDIRPWSVLQVYDSMIEPAPPVAASLLLFWGSERESP
jgi:hypothetical protein